MTLDWLDQHGHQEHVWRAVAVVNAVRGIGSDSNAGPARGALPLPVRLRPPDPLGPGPRRRRPHQPRRPGADHQTGIPRTCRCCRQPVRRARPPALRADAGTGHPPQPIASQPPVRPTPSAPAESGQGVGRSAETDSHPPRCPQPRVLSHYPTHSGPGYALVAPTAGGGPNAYRTAPVHLDHPGRRRTESGQRPLPRDGRQRGHRTGSRRLVALVAPALVVLVWSPPRMGLLLEQVALGAPA